MLHIAEERLHAYVDRDRSDIAVDEIARIEAHAGTCERCRAVIEEGVMFKERADGILARSGPARVVTPDFAAIQARAEGELVPALANVASRRSPRMRPGYVALAWAASLMAALGLGWLTRDLFQGRDQVAVEMTSETEEAVPFAASSVGRDASGGSALPETAGKRPVSPSAEVGSQAVAATAKVSEAPQIAAAPGPSVQPVSPPARPGDLRGIGVAGGTAQGLTAARGAQTDSPRPDNVIAGQAQGSARQTTQDVAVSPPFAAAASSPQSQSAPTEPGREQTARAPSDAATRAQAGAASAAPAAPTPPSGASAARLDWVEMTRTAAERRFGARLLTIPNLRISRIAVLGSGAGSMVRVWQVGPGGTEIALSQARQSARLIQPDVGRRVGEMMLMLEGALPPETLRELLARAR